MTSRRLPAYVLLGLGGLLIAVAASIPTYAVQQLAKTPLDLEITTVASTPNGQGADVLVPTSLTDKSGTAKVDKGVPLVQQRFITAEDPASAKIVTLQAGTTLRRTDMQGDTGLLTATIDRVTINRRSAWPLDNPLGSLQIDAGLPAVPLDHTGVQYRFPYNTPKQTFSFYDINARKEFDLNFEDMTEVNDLPVLHFSQQIPVVNLHDATQLSTDQPTLPAARWGIDGGSAPVTMTHWYTVKRDVWVEPRTGTIVKEQDQPFFFYARSADKPEVTDLKADLVWDESTIENQVAAAKRGIDKLSLYGRVVPLGIGVVGVISVIAGLVYGLRGGRTRRARHSAPMPPRPDADTDAFPRS